MATRIKPSHPVLIAAAVAVLAIAFSPGCTGDKPSDGPALESNDSGAADAVADPRDAAAQDTAAAGGEVGAARKAHGQGYASTPCTGVAGRKKICKPDGQGNAVCATQTCTPNQAFCVGDALHKCGTDGTTSTVAEKCTGTPQNPEVCAGGVCVAKACQPGSVICKDSTTQNVCNSNGGGYVGKACGAGTVCEGGVCGPKVCNPGKDFCSKPRQLRISRRGCVLPAAATVGVGDRPAVSHNPSLR